MKHKHRTIVTIVFILLTDFLIAPHQPFVNAQRDDTLLRQIRIIPSDKTVCWHPSENWVLTDNASNDTIELWDVVSGELIKEFEWKAHPVQLVFNNDGSLIASLSSFFFEVIETQSGNSIYFVDLSTINPDISHYGISSDVTWHPYEMKIAFANDYSLWTYDVPTQALNVYEPVGQGTIFTADWHPNGKLIATDSLPGEIVIRDADTLEPIKTLTWDSGYYDKLPYWYASHALEWNPSGAKIAFVSYSPDDSSVLIWQVESETIITRIPNYGGTITALSWSPDGEKIAVAYGIDALNRAEGYYIRIFDTFNYEPIGLGEGHENTINALSWSFDSTMLASASYDDTVRVWEIPK